MPTTDAAPLTAATLLREVGLLADGPLPWGRPVPARGTGVFVVELAAPLATAPLEMTRVGKWLERVPELRLDGARPTSRALAARLASFWLPGQVVLYIGAASSSIGGRLAAMDQTVLGDRRPSSAGYWLKTLRDVPLRVWWSATEAIEEYEDALLSAFEAGVRGAERAGRDAEAVDPLLPFANLRRPTGERRRTGISGRSCPSPRSPRPRRRASSAARTGTPRVPTASRPSASVARWSPEPRARADPPSRRPAAAARPGRRRSGGQRA